MTKICYVLKSFPLPSETFIYDEAMELRRQGVDVSVLHLAPGDEVVVHESAQSLRREGVVRISRGTARLEQFVALLWCVIRRPHRVVPGLMQALKSPHRWQWFMALVDARWCMANDVAYLHAHFADTNFRHARMISAWSGIPFGVTTHRYDIIEDPIPPHEIAELMQASDVVVTISEFNRRLMAQRFGLDPARVDIVHCGVDMAKFSAADRPTKPISSAERVVVCVGRLVENKGHDVLIRAIGKLVDMGRSVRLDLIGTGPAHDSLRALVEELKLQESVVFLGAKTHQDVQRVVSGADVFVLASRSEGIPVACMESMALGVPTIATRINGIPELIESGVSGLLVEPDDPVGLAIAIARVLDDPALAAALAESGREVVRREFNRVDCTALLRSKFRLV